MKRLDRESRSMPPCSENGEREQPENVEAAGYGEGLPMGARHYRAWVGPPEDYDLIAAIQVSLLLCAGLRETHFFLDVGCGSLRGGRMLIPYLRPGRYFGIEPERWLVEEGIERELGQDILEAKRPSFRFVEDFSASPFGVTFDFVLAQSVLSHTYPDLAAKALGEVGRVLAPEGVLFATCIEGKRTRKGSGWVKAAVPYRWERMRALVEDAGMVARRFEWPHPRQKWFVASLPEAESLIEDLSRRLRFPLRT
jgi:SAM-dependent methyltransferase